MIEYITKTGIFVIFWVILSILFPFIAYRFAMRNKSSIIPVVIPILIIFLLMHQTSKMLLGKTSFDMALTLIKDSWFLIYHAVFMSAFVAIDPKLFDNLFERRGVKDDKTFN